MVAELKERQNIFQVHPNMIAFWAFQLRIRAILRCRFRRLQRVKEGLRIVIGGVFVIFTASTTKIVLTMDNGTPKAVQNNYRQRVYKTTKSYIQIKMCL